MLTQDFGAVRTILVHFRWTAVLWTCGLPSGVALEVYSDIRLKMPLLGTLFLARAT
jgi:hypothetical protein